LILEVGESVEPLPIEVALGLPTKPFVAKLLICNYFATTSICLTSVSNIFVPKFLYQEVFRHRNFRERFEIVDFLI
jgi:hypothetical protein